MVHTVNVSMIDWARELWLKQSQSMVAVLRVKLGLVMCKAV